MDETTIRCSCCEKRLPLSDFPKSKTKKRRADFCLACRRAYRRMAPWIPHKARWILIRGAAIAEEKKRRREEDAELEQEKAAEEKNRKWEEVDPDLPF